MHGPPGSPAARVAAARAASGPAGPRRAPWVGAEPPVGQVVAAAAALLLAAAAVDIAIGATLGILFGAALVVASVGAGLLVRPRDLFTAGVLPPLLLLALLVVIATVHPEGIAVSALDPTAGVAQRVIAGFVDLASALVVAHALALGLVALRVRATRLQRRVRPPAGAVSPAERRPARPPQRP